MCKLCEGKYHPAYFELKEGWLYIFTPESDKSVAEFPISYCPWCGTKLKSERLMPRIITKEMKYQMQEQEAENYEEV